MIRYDAATGEATFVEWDGRGRVSRITIGASKTTATPTARDEFRYGPDGERYYRRTTWTETVSGGGTPTTRTRWAETYRVGGYEKVVGDGLGGYAWVDKTRAGAAQLVRAAATATATPSSALEYLHGDHLGSLAAATDATGGSLQSLAYEPYGTRRKADWTAALPPGDVAALAAAQDAGRARIGFTGHEPLDRTGFVHMGGRLYDPRLGRFLSPDPVVSEAWSGQGWNLYSYVGNSPLSRTDSTGYCYAAGPLCQVAGGGGFTNVTQALTSWNMSWRIPIFATVTWGRVSFGVGGSMWSGEGGGFFGRGGSFRPRVTILIGTPYPVFAPREQVVSQGRESAPADAKTPSAEDEPTGVIDTLRHMWLKRLRGKYLEMRAHCERIHGPGGCDETTVKELAEVFPDATVTLGGAAVGGSVVRASGGIVPLGARSGRGLAEGTIQRMLRAGLEPDRNMLTRAGRGLQKHGDRVDSPFPRSTGTAAERNAQGQRVLEEILRSKNQVVKMAKQGHLDVIDAATGRGVRFRPDGSLRGFIDG